MKFKNKILKILILFLLIIPHSAFAYSNYVIPGGETIGIEVNSKGILIVGFYKVDDKYIAKEAGFKLGDIITKINSENVETIESMVTKLESVENATINFTVLRNQKEKEVPLKLKLESDEVLKTGLYVKDKINGVGTLSYIDPSTRIFGSLGHPKHFLRSCLK